MNDFFDYEIDLVKKFLEFKKDDLSHSITTIEVPVRWGNIDIVSIKNNFMPFNDEQCLVLSKVSNARIFLKTKKNQGISKTKLLSINGMSSSTIENSINQLIKSGLVVKNNNLYYRNIDFSFPKVVISGYEAKLSDYNKAVYQAIINKEYVDYSYMVFPMDVAQKILNTKSEFLISNGIGLIGVSNKKQKVLLKPKKIKEIKQYFRLVNIIQTNLCINKKTLINQY